MKKTQKKSTAKKTPAKRVLTEEQRLKRNAYMREYLREYNKDPEHRKAKSEYQKARYQRMKAEKARADRKAARLAKSTAKVAIAKVEHKHAVAKAAVRKPVAVKKTVKIGKGGNKGK